MFRILICVGGVFSWMVLFVLPTQWPFVCLPRMRLWVALPGGELSGHFGVYALLFVLRTVLSVILLIHFCAKLLIFGSCDSVSSWVCMAYVSVDPIMAFQSCIRSFFWDVFVSGEFFL